MIDLRSFIMILPEVELAVFGLVTLIAAAACGARVTRHIGLLAIVGFAIAGATLFCNFRLSHFMGGVLPVLGFDGQFMDDGFARFVKAIILAASSLSVLLSWNYFEKEGCERPEYPVLIIFATLGMMLMISASNLLSLYVGLELQSLSLYVLAAFNRDASKSSEAGLKYFVLGSLSSGILLYGISLLYGFAGTTDFASLSFALRGQAEMHPGIIVGMVFVCAALTFKVAGVPFHMWAPDVYEGSPTPVTAFFSSAPKIAALAMFVRFLFEPMFGLTSQWHQVITFVSVASMLWGAFAGIAQTNLKRLLAYSSIANVGYMLVGLMVGGTSGLQSLLIYAVIYALGVLGIFAALLSLRKNGKEVEHISDLSGLSKTNPSIALAMALLVFSLAGIPPLAGFFGKYFVFLAAVKAGLLPLAIIGVLSSVVAAYYYLRIIKTMYFDEATQVFDPMYDWGVRTVLGLTSASVVCIALIPAPLVESALKAAQGFLG